MSATTSAGGKPAVFYPDSDGQPIADNTAQFDWIGLLKWNAEAQFADRPDVFVAGDHLVYPVEGEPETRLAPDVYVAFGPRKGDGGSYIAPTGRPLVARGERSEPLEMRRIR